MTSLQSVFQRSRAERNIDLVLPVLREAVLYVVVGAEPVPGEEPAWFVTSSPTEGRRCVTVAESEAALARVKWPKVMLTGEELLRLLPPELEIVIVYADGGDYLNREQLAWYRQPG